MILVNKLNDIGMVIEGKTAVAEIFTDRIEDSALEWIRTLCDHPAMEGMRILQMPDVHNGNGCNVGTAYRVGEYVNPDHVGVDIGCTVSMHRLSSPVEAKDFALLDHRIREVVPTGMEICPKNSINEKELFRFLNAQYGKARSCSPGLIPEIRRIDAAFISDFCRRIKLSEGVFYKSLGSLGGGNHFIEYGEEEDTGIPWLTIHCGSRNPGVKVASYWHNIANNPKQGEMSGFLRGEALTGYLSDMALLQAYALYNHHLIRDRIFVIFRRICKAKCMESIFTTHNYISLDEDPPVLRKGAVAAYAGEQLAIPLNMRDGIAICIGKGNEKWLWTAPHGTGRVMSRSKARKEISLSEFETSMADVFSTSVCESTIDESPMAYKPSEEILRLIEPAVEVLSMVRPRLNIKSAL